MPLFSGSIERDQLHEMGEYLLYFQVINNQKEFSFIPFLITLWNDTGMYTIHLTLIAL